MVTLLLFDIDGTLISAYGAGLRSLQEAFEEVFGLRGIASEHHPHWFAGRNDLWIFRELALAAGIPAGEYDRLYPQLEAVYLARLRENMARWEGRRVLPGVRELLDRLSTPPAAAAGGPGGGAPGWSAPDLGLVTGNLERGARVKLEAFGLSGHFPAGGFGSDAPDRPEIARIARERFERLRGRKIVPGEVALVGDTVHDVTAARACGYLSVTVATGTTTREELEEAGPDLPLDDLSDPSPLLALLDGRSGP